MFAKGNDADRGAGHTVSGASLLGWGQQGWREPLERAGAQRAPREQGLQGGVLSRGWAKKAPARGCPAGSRRGRGKGEGSCWPTGGGSRLSTRRSCRLPGRRPPAQPTSGPTLIQIPPAPRLPAGGKAVNTAPVPGQTPHDESDRRTEPRSSVSDLVNSLTSEMLMVRRAGGLGWGGGGCGAWGSVMQENDPGGRVRLPCVLLQLFHPSSLSVLQFPHLSRQTKNPHPPPVSGWSQGLRKSDT